MESKETSRAELAINVFETSTEVVIVCAMPGIEPEDISVRLEGKTLELKTVERGPDASHKYLVKEWTYGPYRREIELFTPVDGRQANVTYGNGVLTLVLPRARDFVSATLDVPKVGQARGARVAPAHSR